MRRMIIMAIFILTLVLIVSAGDIVFRDGNLGVGTNSPTEEFEVAGNASFSNCIVNSDTNTSMCFENNAIVIMG